MKYNLTSTDALFARNVRFAKNLIKETMAQTGEQTLLTEDGDIDQIFGLFYNGVKPV